jgi:nitrite reductase (cytochrome c-552)
MRHAAAWARRAAAALFVAAAVAVLASAVQPEVAGAAASDPAAKPAPKKAPAQKPPQKKPTQEITEDTVDPAIWGQEFPLHYESYLKTTDQKRTRYGGSEALPRTPNEADPRSVVSQSKIEEDPRLKVIWNGYAFAVDFREERGHAYMLEDQTFTQRQAVVKQPGTCMNCHASVAVLYRKLGDGDATKGFERLNQMPYAEARKQVTHPVTCIDCHEPGTMKLRVTRIAFLEGMKALRASQGVKDYDVNRDASPQEMRTFVCGQCHDEYYFAGPEKRLVYPWSKGLKVEQIMAYYDEIGFKDWVHKDSGAPTLKAQHPEFELFQQGTHARAGVACADCHMPEVTAGKETISDHWVRSPLLNVRNACLKCHKGTEQEMRDRAEVIQTRFFGLRNQAMDATVALIRDITAAKAAGKGDQELEAARYLQRRAQFYLDFVEAENSTGFHADQEAVRILAESINYARQGQLAVRDPKFQPTVKIVAISTAAPGPNQATGTAPAGAAPAPGAPSPPQGAPQQPPPAKK